MITGAKRAIGKDLRRPLLLPSPTPGRSKAEKSKTRKVRVDREAAKSVEETPETAVRQSVAFLEAIAETSDAPTDDGDDDGDLSRYILSKTSSAPTDDDDISRYILSVSEDSEDLSPIQGNIGARLSRKRIKPADPIAPSERADFCTEATEETQVTDLVVALEEVIGSFDEPTDDELPDDPLPLGPGKESPLFEDEDVNWESWTKSSRGFGDRNKNNAPSWGEGTGEAVFRVLGAVVDCASTPCDGKFFSFRGNSKKKAVIGSLYLGDAEREAREDHRITAPRGHAPTRTDRGRTATTARSRR